MTNRLPDKNEIVIPDELVMNQIYVIRGQKVMLDSDLANLYKVETKVLNCSEQNSNPGLTVGFQAL